MKTEQMKKKTWSYCVLLNWQPSSISNFVWSEKLKSRFTTQIHIFTVLPYIGGCSVLRVYGRWISVVARKVMFY